MKTGKKFIVLIVLVFVFLPVFAHAVSWWPLVPCGLNEPTAQEVAAGKIKLDPSYYQPCNQCDLLKLLKNIIDFVLIGLMPPAAAILFVWGGFLILMGGANPGWITQGKSIFWNTVMGIAIILASWLITNSIIRSLAEDNIAPEWWKLECSVTTVPPPPPLKYSCNNNSQCVADSNGQYTSNDCDNKCVSVPVPLSITTTSLSDAIQNQPYSQTLTATGGVTPYIWSTPSGSSLPAGLSMNPSTGVISGTPTTVGTFTFTVKVEDSSSPKKSVTKGLSVKVNLSGQGVACLQSNLNLCQPQSATCTASGCSQYVSSVNQYAGRIGIANGANLLKSIMVKESSCNISEVSFDGSSFGLMQFRPSTANIYKSRCGITANIDSAWLTNSANADASICLGAEYLNALSQTSCGSTVRGMAAGYNGGSGACSNSISCAGETSCAGGPKKKWECLYDDLAHTVCNGGNNPLAGYNETRNYATKVLYCYNNPGF